MKKTTLLVMAILTSISCNALNYFWVGGSGNWSDLSHWSLSPGGGIFHSQVPQSTDNVFFDANSFSSSGQTVTIDQTIVQCADMNWTEVTNTPIFSGDYSNTLRIYGSLSLAAGMTNNFNGQISMETTIGGQTIATAGQILNNTLIFNGIGGEWILQDALTLSDYSSIFFYNGTLNTNNQTVTVSSFEAYSSSFTRILTLGSSTFNFSNHWYIQAASTMTINPGTSTIRGTDISGYSSRFLGGGLTYNDILFTDGGHIYDDNTFHNVTFLGNGTIFGSNTYDNLTFTPGYTYILPAGQTQTINTSFTVNGNCGALIGIVKSSTLDVQASISKASGNVTVSYVTLKDINATGGATFTANNSLDLGNNTGWTINNLPSKNLYWVGNAGNWGDGNHWSTISGGTPSGCSPTPVDNVFFDANSFSLAGQTVTVNVPTAYCNNMNWSGVGNSPTLYGDYSGILKIYGSCMLATAMNFNYIGPISFEATTGGKTITTSGNVINSSLTFNGIGGEWTLQDALTLNNNGYIYLNNGTLNSNNQTVTANSFASYTSSARTLIMGSSTFNLSGGYAWDIQFASGMTLNAGTSTINSTTTGILSHFFSNGLSYHDVFFASGATLSGNNTFHDLTISKNGTINGSNTFDNLIFSPGYTYILPAGLTQTINTSLNVNGNCGALIGLIKSSDIGSQATISKASDIVTVSYATLKDINATGGATFIANNAIDLGNNTGWTINAMPSKNLYWVGNGGNWGDGSHWSATSGGAPSGCSPTAVDNVFFDANSFSLSGQTVTVNVPNFYFNNMNWTGVTNTPTLYGDYSSIMKIFGSLTLANGMNFNYSGPVNFEATTTGQTISTAGKVINAPLNFNGINGEWTLQGELTAPNTISLNNGSLNTNNQIVNAYAFESSTSFTRSLTMGSSTFNLSSSYIWIVQGSGMTLNAGTSTIVGADPNGNESNFYGGGLTYNDAFFAGDAKISQSNIFHTVTIEKNGTINDNNTFDNLVFSPGYTYTLPAGQTQTVNNICAQGNGALPIRIQSSVAGNPATISKASGTICWDYVRVSDISTTGGATFNAGLAPTNSQDMGGNTGLLFTGGCTPVSCPCTSPSITSQPVNRSVCAGNMAIFEINAFGTGLTYQWQVDQGTGFTNLNNTAPYSGVTSKTLNLTSVTTAMSGYQYRCVLTGTCAPISTSNAAMLTVNQSPTIIVNSATICSGQTATLTASGAASYFWLGGGGSNTNSISISPILTTSYMVMGMTGACTGMAFATVTVNPLPTVSVNSATINSGQTATLTASGATNYVWSIGGMMGDTNNPISVSPATTTTYTVTGTTNGCSNTAFATVTVNPLSTLAIISAGPYNITDLPVTLSASITGGTWSGIGITDVINGVFSPSLAGPGSHTITYFLAGPFGGIATTEIMVNALIDGDFIPQNQQNNEAFATIFDRFGNSYTLDDISVKNNPPPPPSLASCNAGYYNLDFVGSGWSGPNAVPMQNLLCQIFSDISALIQPSQCNGVSPIVNIKVLVPSNMPPNALGAATPYFTICCPSDNTGIIDGDVWKAINSGVNDPTLYDGELHVNLTHNWNFNASSTSFPTQFDAYSVYLHEAIHLLGFASLIGPNGQSGAPGLANHYSRFDSYLNSNNNGQLITWNSCYNATFNALGLGDITNINQCSNIVFNAPVAGLQPVTAAAPYQQGTSLSHFNNNCGGATNYVMAPALGLGQFNRVPTLQEVNTLEDLGYQTTGVYGTSPTVPTTGLPAGGQVVAGVDDGFGIGCGSSNLQICATQTILVSPLDNDIGVGGGTGTVTCLRNTGGFGSFTIAGTTFTFNPGGQAGIATFTYIPVSSTGRIGNITCIRIIVSACGATCSTLLNCNQICNPEFTDPQNCFDPNDPSFDPSNSGCGYCPFCITNGVSGNWFQSHGSPQIRNNIGTAPVPAPGGVGLPETVLMAAAPPGTGNREGIITPLINVQPGVRYIFSYSRMRMSSGGSSFPIMDNMHIRLLNSTQLNGIAIPTLSTTIPAIPPVNFEILHETNVTSTNWEQVTVCFATPSNGPAYDWLWIYPEQNVGSPFSIILVDWVQLMEDNFTAGNDQTITCGDVIVGVAPLCAVKNVSQQWAWGSNTSPDPQLTFAGANQLNQTTTFTLNRSFPTNPGGVANSCVTSDNVTVNINSPIQLTTTKAPNVNCGSNNGTASVTVTGGTSPYTFQWIDINNNILTTQSVTGLAAGTYTVTVTDANGCLGTAMVTITQNITLPTITLGNNPSVCIGATTANLTYSATTGSPNQYSIDYNAGANSAGFVDVTNAVLTASSIVLTVPAGVAQGTYNYTVSVINSTTGCASSIIAKTLTVNPLPTITLGSNPSVCSGTTTANLTYSATTGSPNQYSIDYNATAQAQGFVDITNSILTASPIVLTIPGGAALGTYNYTISVKNNTTGCVSSSIPKTVTINPLPTANFSFPPFDNVEDVSSGIFTNTSTNATSYTWNFMDGTTSTAVSPSHVFPYPGYYQVTLSATNSCGTVTNSQNIYIIPSMGSYSYSRACLINFPYSNTNPNVPAGNDKSISVPITWNNTFGIIRIKGTLTIQTGASLTISGGAIVEFGPQGKVIVKPGALLSINGATLRGTQFTSCGGKNPRMMWQGIEVWGNASTTIPSQQGKITINNNAFIEDAYNGIMLGKSLLVYQTNSSPSPKFWYNGHDAPSGGGIIQAANSTFNRCNVSVKFWDYPYNNNLSSIKSCKFFCKTSGVNSAVLDPYFIYTNPTGNEYDNAAIAAHNPFYNALFYNTLTIPPSSGTNTGRSMMGIDLFNRGTIIPILDNVFDFPFAGINASNARFNVMKGTGSGNSFINNKYGVRIHNLSSSPLAGHTISNNTFQKFYTGINIYGNKDDIIKNNQFNTILPQGTQADNQIGISLSNSTNFNIVDNLFTRLRNGIVCYSSGGAASLIGYQSGGNTFTKCYEPIRTSGTNSMLSIRCNNFDNVPTFPTEYSGRNWISWGTLANQGYGSNTNKKAPAGNRFQPYSPPRNLIEATTSPYFKYFHHIEAITKPSKFSTSSNFVIMQNMVHFTSVSDACTPGPVIICCYKQMLQEQTDAITLLKQEYINVQNTTDQGQTSTLLAAIQNNNTPVNTLKSQLINNSPLSDTVLTKLINRPSPLPPPVLRDVLKRNSPVSEKVYPDLEVKLDNMPPPFADSIRKYQVVNPSYRTLTNIAIDIATAENVRQSILNDAVSYYADNDSIPQAIALLELETNKETKQGLVGAYIDQGNYSSALLKLNSIPLIADEDIAFKNLYSMYINLAVQQKTLWDMDSLQLQMVRDIAIVCPSTLASVNASAVLAIVLGENTPPCPDNQNLRSVTNNSTQQNLLTISMEDIEYLGNNIPNPFNNSTQIPYFIPTGSKATLEVFGIKGELIKTYTLTEGSNKLEVSLAEYGNGLYFYTLTIDDGRVVRHKKMILNK